MNPLFYSPPKRGRVFSANLYPLLVGEGRVRFEQNLTDLKDQTKIEQKLFLNKLDSACMFYMKIKMSNSLRSNIDKFFLRLFLA
jgi:hypothetical protein